MNRQPPKLPIHFFRWYCHQEYLEDLEGDLVERFEKTVEEKSLPSAKWQFTMDVIRLFRPGIMRPMAVTQWLNKNTMIKNYLTIGWRNLIRNKNNAFINISGLAIGMAVTMLIGLWVFNELSHNKSFDNYSKIGRIYHNLDFGEDIITYEGMPYPLGEAIQNNFTEFDEVVMMLVSDQHALSYDEKKLSEVTYFTDAKFPDLFPLPMIEGTRAGLNEQNSVMLSRSVAEALFDEDALGKVIQFDDKDYLTVTGVYEDFSKATDFANVKVIVPIDYHFNMNDDSRFERTNWENFDYESLVLLNAKSDWVSAEEKISSLLFGKSPESIKPMKPKALLHPMAKWNLYADFKNGKNVEGKISLIRMLGGIGILVLALACINFMNLSTAQSEKRSKEIGIRKVMGSARSQLIGQFIGESLLTSILAFLIAVLLVFLFLPSFNSLNETQLVLPWYSFNFLGVSLIFILLTSLLAGSYPAIYLSAFQPVKTLKGTFKTGRFSAISRKLLVVFQFTVSSIMIVGTWVIFAQIQYTKSRPLGFDLANIIQLPIQSDDLANANYNSLRHDLLATGVVENMAFSDHPITGSMSSDASLSWLGKNPDSQTVVAINHGSHDFPGTNGFIFIKGRDFSREYSTDSSAVIVNEMAAKLFAPDGEALGIELTFGEGEANITKKIIGVIKDQIRWEPFAKQSPHIYTMRYGGPGFLTVKVKPDMKMETALHEVERIIKKYDPNSPFSYTFQDADYTQQFKGEERIGKLSSIFSVLAVFVSCIGIFGLASFASSQRNKEMGIRKILGASVLTIWKILSTDFVKLVLISTVIASPIAYILAGNWLEKYYYRIEFSWSILFYTFFILLGITLVTVSFKSIRAAVANPIDAIRND